MTTANEITFGLEFETTMPQADPTPIGDYHRGVQVSWLPNGWRAEKDGSIQTTPDRKGCEFVSPKLTGLAGMTEVAQALTAMTDRGAKVNPTCGLHITITWNGDAPALARLLTLVANHETAIYASTGTKNRERGLNGRCYTKPIKSYGNHQAAKRTCEGDRYHLINLTHLAAGSKRIEFRAFAGTLNVEKVFGYLMMVLGLAELALNNKRCSGWSYEAKPGKPGPWARQGAGRGETELNRMFYRLGWTKGQATKVWGLIDGANLVPVKKELRRLAAKYDEMI